MIPGTLYILLCECMVKHLLDSFTSQSYLSFLLEYSEMVIGSLASALDGQVIYYTLHSISPVSYTNSNNEV